MNINLTFKNTRNLDAEKNNYLTCIKIRAALGAPILVGCANYNPRDKLCGLI